MSGYNTSLTSTDMQRLLMRDNSNLSGLVPELDPFEDAINARFEQILSQVPFAMEGFNADLASRGIYSSGEAPGAMYRDVLAPVAGQLASVATQGRLQFEGMRQQGAMTRAQIKEQQLQRALQMWGVLRAEEAQPSFLEELIGTAVGYAPLAL